MCGFGDKVSFLIHLAMSFPAYHKLLTSCSGSSAHHPTAVCPPHHYGHDHGQGVRLQVGCPSAFLLSLQCQARSPHRVLVVLTYCGSDLDHAMFVLNVDLWDAKGENEVNLVRSSQGAPSISATSPFSYGSLNGGDANGASYSHQVVQSGRDQHYGQPPAMAFGQDYQPVPPGYASGTSTPHNVDFSRLPCTLTSSGLTVSTAYSPNGNYGPPAQYYQNQGYRPDPSMSPLPAYANMVPYGSRNGSMSSYGQDHSSQGRVSVFGTAPTGMFSRNLIGSLAASAFRLVDTEDRVGIWFVLQDLSVRTEGSFR